MESDKISLMVGNFMFRRKKNLETEREQLNERKKESEVVSQDKVQTQLIPEELFNILGFDLPIEYSERCLEEQKQFFAGIMNVDVYGFKEITHQMAIRQTYQFINEVLTICIPQISERNGMITEFHNSGVNAMFTENLENGIDAAIMICEESYKYKASNRSEFAIGLCYGTVMAGLVGHKQRMSVLTLSPYTGLCTFLQEIAGRYYSKILITGNYLKKIPSYEKKYNYRLIGYLYMKAENQVEEIYDLFDGDTAEIRNQKRKTKMVFEKGIKLFVQKNYAEARTYFIEVLKTNHYDAAAREYVLRCDQYKTAELDSEQSMYIEIY